MELLSPAGNLETAIAAFDGGADAVYCGLGKFNARERAENFSKETLGKLLNFAKENGRKVYITLNTLIWESELSELFEQLLILDQMTPDALIVQDPGVCEIVRKYFPQMVLHASTQMGIHNSAGIAVAEKLGFKRVILERQISLDELRQIAKNSSLELEVFLHGSLCCSLSGRCLLSHHLYGESGNRGKCKQPCRRAFEQGKMKNMRILSPADLAGSSLLSELDKLNIASLKIEGRLRTPDYIWKTARAYRILLDNPDDPEAAVEAENIFRTVPGRKKSTGFYFKSSWKSLIDPSAGGSFGECCAKVNKVIRSGMLVKVATSLHLGDRLRVMPAAGGEGESFSLAAMENHNRTGIIRARSGETVFIKGNFRAAPGYEIRRIGENGFDFSRRAAALSDFRQEFALKITASPTLWQAEIPGSNAVWQESTDFAPAEKRPLTEEQIKKVFSENPPAGFRPGKIEVCINGNFFVPAATLKSLRRNCREFFTPVLGSMDFFPEHPVKMEKFYAENQISPDLPPEILPQNIFTIPDFIPENELDNIRQEIKNAYANGERNFSAGHWHAFELLKNLPQVKIFTRYPFHISNSFSAKLAEILGASCVAATPECDENNRILMQKKSPLPFFEDKRAVPLLVSRIPLAKGKWELDGKKFKITETEKLSVLHSHDPFEVSR